MRKRKRNSSKKLLSARKRREILAAIQKYLKPLLLVSLFIFLIGISYYTVMISDVFLISDIDLIGGGEFVNRTDLWNFVNSSYKNENLVFLRAPDISEQIEDRFLAAKHAHVTKIYPDKLTINIEERVPLALLSNDYVDDIFMVDIEGYVLGAVSPDFEDLPKIDYMGDLRIGEFVIQDLVLIYHDLIEATDRSNITATEMVFYSDYAVLYTSKGIRVLVSYYKDREMSVKTASRLIHNLTLEGKNPVSIDLRYDKVVVSY